MPRLKSRTLAGEHANGGDKSSIKKMPSELGERREIYSVTRMNDRGKTVVKKQISKKKNEVSILQIMQLFLYKSCKFFLIYYHFRKK